MTPGMAHAHYPSLLDDPEFISALDGLEIDGPEPIERPMNRWFVEPQPERGPASYPPPRHAVVQVAFDVAAFLFMMGLGGLAAAYVFADRVVLLVSR